MSEVVVLVAALLSGGVGAAIVTAWANRGKTRAEVDKIGAEAVVSDAQSRDVITQAAERAVAILEAQINRMDAELADERKRVAALRAQVDELQATVDRLRSRLRDVEEGS